MKTIFQKTNQHPCILYALPTKSLLLLAACFFVLSFMAAPVFAQSQKIITGTVTNDLLKPVANVSVTVKGKPGGTATDSTGKFQINVSKGGTLVFSYVGMTTQEVEITDQENVDIQLSSTSASLRDVVVVAYGTQKKATLTGAVSSVQSREIVETKNENVQNMLTGKVAGLRVSQNSSEPGSFDNSFDIRGLGTPLIVIDGIPRDNISRIDPNDIESVSILKDASAAVYGVRAANGVVLITTKKGKRGTTELNYSGNWGWQVPAGLPESVGAVDYMTLANEKSMHNVNGGRLSFTDADFAPYLDGTKKSTNWYSPTFKNAVPQSQQNLSANGGNEKTTYYISLGYTAQDGFLKTGDLNYKRYNVRSNITSNITKNLSVDLNLNGIVDQKNQPYQDAWWIIRSVWRQLPTQSVYANDNPDYLINTQVDGTNPIAMSNSDIAGYKIFSNKWFQSSLGAHYQVPFVDGLRANVLFSYDYNNADNKIYQKQYYQYNYDASSDTYNKILQQSPNSIRREYYARPSTLSQVSLNYDHVFGNRNNVSALLLFEQSVRSADNFYVTRELSLPVDQLVAGNSLRQQGYLNTGQLYKLGNQGLVGRLNYGFQSRYLAEFSFRYDGSSKFASANRWGFFPSGSVGWRVSQEDFWKQTTALRFINELKLRGSYGKLGDDAASSYQFITGYNYPASGSNNQLPPGSVFDETFVNSLESKGLPNPNITWFVSKTLDIGLDAEAWRGLLGVTVDVFKRDRSGLLATRALSLPAVVGATLPQENLNGDRTQGIDLEINHKNHIGQVSYYMKGIFSYTRTKNTYVEKARAGNSWENWRNNSNNRFNNTYWGYGAAGQYQSYQDIVNSSVYVGRSAVPGDYAYQDWNGDGQISDLDVHPIAYTGVPLINYGLTIGASFKGIDLNMLWQGTGKVNVSYIEQLREPLWGGGSGLQQFLDRWHPADPLANPYDPNTKWISGHYAYTGSLPDVNSLYNIQNGAYLRLKSVEIGYSIPTGFSSKIGIKDARIYVNGYNILTVSKIKYVDPEHPSSLYGYIYPLNKTFNAGVNIKL